MQQSASAHLMPATRDYRIAGRRLLRSKALAQEMGRGRGDQEDTRMTQTWNALCTWWNHVIGVLLAALVLCVSACTGPGHSSSVPSTHSPEGGMQGRSSQGTAMAAVACDRAGRGGCPLLASARWPSNVANLQKPPYQASDVSGRAASTVAGIL